MSYYNNLPAPPPRRPLREAVREQVPLFYEPTYDDPPPRGRWLPWAYGFVVLVFTAVITVWAVSLVTTTYPRNLPVRVTEGPPPTVPFETEECPGCDWGDGTRAPG